MTTSPASDVSVAIDLGSERIRVMTLDPAVVLDEPAWDPEASEPAAVRHGVVVDFDASVDLVARLVRRIAGDRPVRRAIAATPVGSSGAEQRRLQAVVQRATGTASAFLCEAPVAAAWSSGFRSSSGAAVGVADAGAGVVQVAIVWNGTVVASAFRRRHPSEAVAPLLLEAIAETLDRAIPERTPTIWLLVGGASDDPALLAQLRTETGLSVRCPSDAHHAVVRGSAGALRG